MRSPSFQYRCRRLIACLLLLAHLAACANWRHQKVSPQEAIADKKPNRVRVTLSDGTRREYWHPRIESDSLWGLKDSPSSAHHKGEAASEAEPTALAEVTKIEILKRDTVNTVLQVSLVVLVAGVVAAAYALSQWCGPVVTTC